MAPGDPAGPLPVRRVARRGRRRAPGAPRRDRHPREAPGRRCWRPPTASSSERARRSSPDGWSWSRTTSTGDGLLPPLGGRGRARPGGAARRRGRTGRGERERDGAAPAFRRCAGARAASAASGSTAAGRIPTRHWIAGNPCFVPGRAYSPRSEDRLTYPVPCHTGPGTSPAVRARARRALAGPRSLRPA